MDILDMTQQLAAMGNWEYLRKTKQLHWSRGMYRILGWQPEQCTADLQQLFTIVHPEDREMVESIYNRSLAAGTNHDIEYRICRPDGYVRRLRDRCLPRHNYMGESTSLVGFLQDVTELVETRRAMSCIRAEMDEFISIASHDLQGPLKAITGLLQLLDKRHTGQLDDKGAEFLERSIAASNRMSQQINGLLQLSRIVSRETMFTETDSNAIINKVAARLAMLIRAKEATIDCPQLPVLLGDEQQLTTLFYHLIHNGLQYNNSRSPTVVIEAQTRDQWCCFSLKDNGIGISPLFHEQIFTVFQRLHGQRDYPGMGMGLTLGKKIVEYHGGRIWVESAEQQGATFFFTLPLAASAS